MGICLHPKYGGWFAMRCVFLFKNIVLLENDLERPHLEDPLGQDGVKIENLLWNFNFNWKNSAYRDAIRVEEKYSHLQIEYFTTEPKYRKEMLRNWLAYPNKSKLIDDYDLKTKSNNLLKNFYLE